MIHVLLRNNSSTEYQLIAFVLVFLEYLLENQVTDRKPTAHEKEYYFLLNSEGITSRAA